ncbi:2-oxoadipate dioxygenase/decarboxylase family protein [Corynebacterium nasicanis]|uniref:2-oxoadipate dioxygenase/decarboxylase n=1 Tax=Corynebacterium nasicanis TaxID=1448267 RepID=A0ABW1QCH3_9CORY
MVFQPTWELRRDFAAELSRMYGTEVPAYDTLVEVSTSVNSDFVAAQGADAERLGSIERVTAERHGAIRVGSPRELAQAARVFAAFGMFPVGFYDLREAAKSSVPVVSTAFRPVDAEELARNPFRVFTSMLTTDDPRFFSADLQEELQEFISSRVLFDEPLLALADRASRDGGLEDRFARRLVDMATAAFELTETPVDHAWYRRLEEISAVAADIGGVPSTHINHLTPRVLDIDDLYHRMEERGIAMIDEVQGPPAWEGPDILLRQTSFRALEEKRVFRFEDGTVGEGSLRVRFGEVEQRGIALTPQGRELYDHMLAETDRRLAAGEGGGVRTVVAELVWRENLPDTEEGLRRAGLAYFTYSVSAPAVGETPTDLDSLIAHGVVKATPIVYEDFLPRSAAGIFQSNLTDEGTRDNAQQGTDYSLETLSEIIGHPIADPYELYARQEAASLHQLEIDLGHPVHIEATINS